MINPALIFGRWELIVSWTLDIGQGSLRWPLFTGTKWAGHGSHKRREP
jgi:hypothetical protein